MDRAMTAAGHEPLSEDRVRSTLAGLLPPRRATDRPTVMGAGSDDLATGREYLAATLEGGWAVPLWPRVHGGRDASPEEADLVARIRREFAVPDLYAYAIGLHMAGPTLLAHGTASQQDRWLRPIADGSEIWCQLFSEPEAGSDLANAGLRAKHDGSAWRLDGQKVWVSRGMYATWGLCLARTDPEAPKHQGLTMFGVNMSTPGVEVRPLAQMNGDKHFSEVFFDGVELDDANRIGDVGAGWKVAMTVLGFERVASAEEGPAPSGLPRWLQELAGLGVLKDPLLRDRATRTFITGEVNRLTAARSAAGADRSGPAGSGAKLNRVRQYKAEAQLLKDAHGAAGMLAQHEGSIEFLTAPSMSIRGGTDEIQRNIIGERVLGLPAEARVDRDIPWSSGRRGVL